MNSSRSSKLGRRRSVFSHATLIVLCEEVVVFPAGGPAVSAPSRRGQQATFALEAAQGGMAMNVCRTFLVELTLRWIDLLVDCVFFLANVCRRKKVLAPVKDSLLLQPAVELAAKIRQGKVHSADVIRAYVNRIKEVNPVLNAVVEDRFEEAISEGERIDELVRSGTMTEEELLVRKPLLGVPFITKNSVGVKGCLIDMGVVSSKDERATEDAEAIRLVREAGAIFIALTNTPELCLWTESFNKLHGRTCNPYDTRTTCGGSSGGEGSLLGAAAAVLGVATDIAGSIRIPAIYCGVFGHTPTPGIVSNEGQRNYFSDAMMEHYVTGPMCRYVADLVPLFKVMAGPRAKLLNLEQEVNLEQLKVYYMEDEGCRFLSRVHKDMRRAVRNVVAHFKDKYGVQAQRINLETVRFGFEMWLAKLVAGGGEPITHQFKKPNGNRPISPFAELLKSVVHRSRHTFPTILLTILETKILPKPDSAIVKKFLQMADDLETALRDTLGDDGVLIYPGCMEPATYHNVHVGKIGVIGYTSAFNVAKVPATACPTGLTRDGRPVGVQVVAGPNRDHLCLAVAAELEKAFGGWQSPCSIQCSSS